jgi:hypothetical protein
MKKRFLQHFRYFPRRIDPVIERFNLDGHVKSIDGCRQIGVGYGAIPHSFTDIQDRLRSGPPVRAHQRQRPRCGSFLLGFCAHGRQSRRV